MGVYCTCTIGSILVFDKEKHETQILLWRYYDVITLLHADIKTRLGRGHFRLCVLLAIALSLVKGHSSSASRLTLILLSMMATYDIFRCSQRLVCALFHKLEEEPLHHGC